MRITIRQVEAFHALMEVKTVGGAADMMNISQPAVSRLISDLEAETKLRLFDRIQGRLVPTAEAEELLIEVERSFVGLEQIRQTATYLSNNNIGVLRILAMPSMSGDILCESVARFKHAHPKVDILWETRPKQRVLEWLTYQGFDLGFITLPCSDKALGKKVLTNNMPCYCILPKGHRLSDKDYITARDLEDENMITFPLGSEIRHVIDKSFQEVNNHKSRIEVRNIETVCSLVAKGTGASILYFFDNLQDWMDKIDIRPFKPDIKIGFAVVYPQSRIMSRNARGFLDIYQTVHAERMAQFDQIISQ